MPKALKLLHDTRASRVPLHEPVPRAAPPELPPDVSDEVRHVWDRLVGELTTMGVAHAADRDSLYALAEAIVAHRRASRRLAIEGLIIDGQRGPVRNPLVAQARDAAQLVRVLATEFGLTPSSRGRFDTGVRARDDDGINPFAG